MRPLLVVPLLVAALPVLLAGCPDDCADCSINDGPPSGPTTDVHCVDAAAPAATDPVVLLGSGSNDAFMALSNGANRQIDYGDQGGQHFYVTVRWYAPPSDGVIVLDYTGDSNNHGSQTVFNDPGCPGWLEASTYVQLDDSVDETGTLHAAAGQCAASGCAYDENANKYVLETTVAEADLGVHLTP